MVKEPTENLNTTIPISLLAILDHYCQEADLDRTKVTRRALRLYLGTKIAKENAFWEREYNRLCAEGKIKDLK